MLTEIKKNFIKVLINSLNTQQINYLGTLYDSSFDLYHKSGSAQEAPIEEKAAADILLNHFEDEEDAIRLFSVMLKHEGKHFHNGNLTIQGKDDFISFLKLNKWIYDHDLNVFLTDPFYERETNFFKNIQTIDLRNNVDIDRLINTIISESKAKSAQNNEWRITIKLYDLDSQNEKPIKIIIDLLLSQQNLQSLKREVFFCLKELAMNAAKANYKQLFEKYFAPQQKSFHKESYSKFLEAFKDEIAKNGNKKLLELAKKDDQFYTITFQSTDDSIIIWVTNAKNGSPIERAQILKKMSHKNFSSAYLSNDDISEGAGLGLSLIINILKQCTTNPNPLKGVFYDDFIKMGFELEYAKIKVRSHA